MRLQHMHPITERIRDALLLAMRQQADRGPEAFKHLIAAGSGDDRMKGPVFLNEGVLVGQSAHPFDRRLEFVELAFGAVLCRLRRKRGLDDLTRLQDIAERSGLQVEKYRKRM